MNLQECQPFLVGTLFHQRCMMQYVASLDYTITMQIEMGGRAVRRETSPTEWYDLILRLGSISGHFRMGTGCYDVGKNVGEINKKEYVSVITLCLLRTTVGSAACLIFQPLEELGLM
ncbi:hypothetical protein CEXT_779581 [Caerostris extrusa]|uniref:Uncharacterized protein n=1 Tax=Caerostris extrusa TaxID=172846 RepID=A0AAV4Y071_CAEEX|nr:hypothetical protein CEXT_779581 [Caerostris extrusa]